MLYEVNRSYFDAASDTDALKVAAAFTGAKRLQKNVAAIGQSYECVGKVDSVKVIRISRLSA